MGKNKDRLLSKPKERQMGVPTMTNISEVAAMLQSNDSGGVGGTYSRKHQKFHPKKGIDLGLKHMGKA